MGVATAELTRESIGLPEVTVDVDVYMLCIRPQRRFIIAKILRVQDVTERWKTVGDF
jgi:hypothetical protein